MPVFQNGGTTLVGLLRASTSEGKEPEKTTMRLAKKYHVWNVRTHKYLGYKQALDVKLDLLPKYYALLPVNPRKMSIEAASKTTPRGKDATIVGKVNFAPGKNTKDIASIRQAVHVRVYSPSGEELEHYRQNILFDGRRFEITLPISYSEELGSYRIEAEHAITGMKATASFDVLDK